MVRLVPLFSKTIPMKSDSYMWQHFDLSVIKRLHELDGPRHLKTEVTYEKPQTQRLKPQIIPVFPETKTKKQ